MEILEATSKPAKGNIILFHGLNNPPSLMNELGEFLQKNGFNILIGSLSGHRGDSEKLKTLTKDDLVNDIDQAVGCFTKKYPGLPLIYLGFSLGGTVGLAYAQKHPTVFSKILLLAPAIEFRFFANLGRVLLPWKDTISIYSLASKRFNLYRWMPLNVYNAMIELRDGLYQSAYENIEAPVLLLMHPKDEVVSFHRIRKTVREYKLPWKTIGFEHPTKSVRHLVAIPSLMGEKNLAVFQREVLAFLHKKTVLLPQDDQHD
ncbi:alpha/beta fold hydrolase [Flammeovirgaceae bacterium SG7u.111]|nr:alpha/beta fold hydrolase [Flammeovirgaceae bacterium SG7u.132]WPO38297.1 alpha/beta fold hydrolase [Flammeovirgaceae bacterium SG7u.111]